MKRKQKKYEFILFEVSKWIYLNKKKIRDRRRHVNISFEQSIIKYLFLKISI